MLESLEKADRSGRTGLSTLVSSTCAPLWGERARNHSFDRAGLAAKRRNANARQGVGASQTGPGPQATSRRCGSRVVAHGHGAQQRVAFECAYRQARQVLASLAADPRCCRQRLGAAGGSAMPRKPTSSARRSARENQIEKAGAGDSRAFPSRGAERHKMDAIACASVWCLGWLALHW